MSSNLLTLYQDIYEILIKIQKKDKDLTERLKHIQLCFKEAQARCEIVKLNYKQGLEHSVKRRETFKKTKREFQDLRDELKDLVEMLFEKVWSQEKEVESFYDSSEE